MIILIVFQYLGEWCGKKWFTNRYVAPEQIYQELSRRQDGNLTMTYHGRYVDALAFRKIAVHDGFGNTERIKDINVHEFGKKNPQQTNKCIYFSYVNWKYFV